MVASLIQKCKSAIFSKIEQFNPKIKPDRLKYYQLIKQSDELNYKLIKYICNKNFYNQAKNEQLRRDYLENNNQDECNAQSFLEIAKKLKNASNKLSSKINKRLKEIDNINILLFNGGILCKEQIYEALEALRIHCIFYNAYYHGLAQQEWFSSFIRKNLRIILSQGKLEKTKIITQKQCEELIEKNKEILNELEKQSGNRQQKIRLETRKIIFAEIEQHINKIHKVEQVQKSTCKMQQLQQEVNEVKDEALKCVEGVITRGQPLEVLLEKTENLVEGGEEFFVNTKRIKHKTANNKIFYYALAVVAAIAVAALICYCIYTTFSKPSQSLDNVALMQNMGKLINSIT